MTVAEFKVETWAELWPEIDALGEAGFNEGNRVPGRPYRLDYEALAELCLKGILRTVTARRAGALVGYAMWLIGPDIESAGRTVASQAVLYTRPGEVGITALRLFEESARMLRRLGVSVMLPHVPAEGRGKKLGNFFAKRGAKPLLQVYCLPLDGSSALPLKGL